MKKFLIPSSFLIIGLPLVALAANDSYQMLAPIQQLTGGGNTVDLATYIPNMIKLIIGLASALAVIKIIIGGIQYMSTDAVGGKSAGKDTIQNALLGLLLAISAYTILYTVNPKLLNIDLNIDRQAAGAAFDASIGTTTQPINGVIPTGCSICIAMNPSIVPQKPVGTGCASTAKECVVTPTLAQKLIQLAGNLRGKVTWEVTEMFPPTVNHKDPCHRNGTCVDAALRAITTGRLIIFLTEVEKVFGKNYEYETCDQTRLNALQNDPQLVSFKDRFKCESTTVGGESIHLEQ